MVSQTQLGRPYMRAGRKTSICSEISQLIFSQIGPEFPVKSQAALRSAAQVGSYQLTALRLHPETVSTECLIRLAEAAGIDVGKALRVAGRKCSDEEIEASRKKTKMDMDLGAKGFSSEELQALLDLGKLVFGFVPISLASQFIEIRRINQANIKANSAQQK